MDAQSCATPCTLSAPNGAGTYNVSFKLNGYQPQSIPVRIAVTELKFHAIRRLRQRPDHGHHPGPDHGRTCTICADSHETARCAHKGKARDDNRRDLRILTRCVTSAARGNNRRDLRIATRFVTSAARDNNRRALRIAARFVTSAARDNNRRDLRIAARFVTSAARDNNRRDLRIAAPFVTFAARDNNRRDLGTAVCGLARSKGKDWGLAIPFPVGGTGGDPEASGAPGLQGFEHQKRGNIRAFPSNLCSRGLLNGRLYSSLPPGPPMTLGDARARGSRSICRNHACRHFAPRISRGRPAVRRGRPVGGSHPGLAQRLKQFNVEKDFASLLDQYVRVGNNSRDQDYSVTPMHMMMLRFSRGGDEGPPVAACWIYAPGGT